MDRIDEAIRVTVHRSELTPKEQAATLGKNYTTYMKKASEEYDHDFTIREFISIMKLTKNTVFVDALSEEFSDREAKHDSLMSALIHTMKESGDITVVLDKYSHGERLTGHGKKELVREAGEAIESLKDLVAYIETLEVGKPIQDVS